MNLSEKSIAVFVVQCLYQMLKYPFGLSTKCKVRGFDIYIFNSIVTRASGTITQTSPCHVILWFFLDYIVYTFIYLCVGWPFHLCKRFENDKMPLEIFCKSYQQKLQFWPLKLFFPWWHTRYTMKNLFNSIS